MFFSCLTKLNVFCVYTEHVEACKEGYVSCTNILSLMYFDLKKFADVAKERLSVKNKCMFCFCSGYASYFPCYVRSPFFIDKHFDELVHAYIPFFGIHVCLYIKLLIYLMLLKPTL